MAPAVANPLLLGYKALYRTLLEDSKRGMALALRPFVEEGNFPILVHCIHGKDRTGLIIMLLLLLCDVDAEVRSMSLSRLLGLIPRNGDVFVEGFGIQPGLLCVYTQQGAASSQAFVLTLKGFCL